MHVVTQGVIDAAQFDRIAEQVSQQQNLKDMMAWALSQPKGTFGPHVVSEVIVQDEFTHDVIVPWINGLVLVYDTT